MNRLGWILFGIAALALVLLFSCRGEGIDEVRADSVTIAAAASEAAWDAAVLWATDSALATLPDSAARAARDDSLRRAGAAEEARARASAVAGADSLRDALVAARMEVWVPVLDGIIASKDEEREAAVATERRIADALRADYAALDTLFTFTVDSLVTAGNKALDASKLRGDFWEAEARRLADRPTFQIKAPVGLAAAAVGGFALGAVLVR